MKRKIKYLLFLLVAISALYGCNDNSVKKAGEVNIYYINKDITGLTSKTYLPKSKDSNALVEELMGQMYSNDLDIEYNKSKPDAVSILKYEINDKIANVYFDYAYNEMDNVAELMCRASLVLTLTQINDIDYVNIYVDNQPLMGTNKNPIGNMEADDFVNLNEDTLEIEQIFTTILYYANEEGNRLVPYTYTGTYEINKSSEEIIIDKLKEGVDDKRLQKTIPKDVELINVSTKDGICYVNFSEEFLTESLEITDEVAIYSIVNSLFEANYITKVQFTIEGEKDKMYHESISLEKMFMRNLNIVDIEAN